MADEKDDIIERERKVAEDIAELLRAFAEEEDEDEDEEDE
jgi:hypothetical protein